VTKVQILVRFLGKATEWDSITYSTCRPEQAAQRIHHFGKTRSPRSSGMWRVRWVRVFCRNAGTARRGKRQNNGCRQAPLVPAYYLRSPFLCRPSGPDRWFD